MDNYGKLSIRLTYFKKLGIAPTGDLKEIKKAYRKKAFALHPDKNPSPEAEKAFIALTEAYEFLIGIENQADKNPKTAEEQRAAKLKKARTNYRRMQALEKEKDASYFRKITSGLQWRIFKTLAVYAMLLSGLLAADYFITGETKASEKMDPYNLMPNMVKKNGEIFEVDPTYNYQSEVTPTRINYGFFFHDLKSIEILTDIKYLRSELPQDIILEFQLFAKYHSVEIISYSSVYYLFPFLHLFLLLPIFLVRFKRPTINFSIGRLLAIWVIFPIVIILSFSNGRIFHLFGLF